MLSFRRRRYNHQGLISACGACKFSAVAINVNVRIQPCGIVRHPGQCGQTALCQDMFLTSPLVSLIIYALISLASKSQLYVSVVVMPAPIDVSSSFRYPAGPNVHFRTSRKRRQFIRFGKINSCKRVRRKMPSRVYILISPPLGTRHTDAHCS